MMESQPPATGEAGSVENLKMECSLEDVMRRTVLGGVEKFSK
jgi:hypothetical protein